MVQTTNLQRARAAEARDSLENPSVPIYTALVGYTDATLDSATGASVTPQRAMRVLAFFACVRLLANTLASLDMEVFSRGENGRQLEDDDPRALLLKDEPNPDMTAFTFWLFMWMCVFVWGNAFAWIETDADGNPVALWPIAPTKISERRVAGRKVFIVYTGPDTSDTAVLLQDELLILSGLGLEVGRGLAPYSQARQALGISMAAEDYAGRTFQNDSRPAGIIQSDKPLTDTQFTQFMARWKSGHEGLKNSHKVGYLPPGMTFQNVTFDPTTQQHIEAREFEVMEMARLFGIPLHYLGLRQTTTYASVEAQSIDFVTYTLLPYLKMAQQEVKRKLFQTPDDIASRAFVEHDTQPLMRADSVSRAKVATAYRMWGIYSANEVREDEGKPPYPGGDLYWAPVTGAPIGDDGKFLEPPLKPLAGTTTTPTDSMPPDTLPGDVQEPAGPGGAGDQNQTTS